MPQISHDGSNTQKINEILEAAQRRFGVYGLEKTAMHEIAQDLGISKASLYYYYPDKEALFKAVVDKESDLYISALTEKMALTSDPSELLRIYLDVRFQFFKTLLNLTRVRLTNSENIKNIFEQSRLGFRDKERLKLIEILQLGKSKGVFEFDDAGDIAEFFLDTIRGITLVFKKNRDISYFNEEDYAWLQNKIIMFVNLFIKGISK